MSEEVEAEEEQGKLMYTNAEGQGSQSNRSYNRRATNYNEQQTRDYNREYRGRGRGGRFYNQGRGRGRNFDYSRIMCYRCDKNGHFAADCPDRLLKLQEAHETYNTETQDAEELMMLETVFLNEKHVVPEI